MTWNSNLFCGCSSVQLVECSCQIARARVRAVYFGYRWWQLFEKKKLFEWEQGCRLTAIGPSALLWYLPNLGGNYTDQGYSDVPTWWLVSKLVIADKLVRTKHWAGLYLDLLANELSRQGKNTPSVSLYLSKASGVFVLIYLFIEVM